jgi:hypothetical protein
MVGKLWRRTSAPIQPHRELRAYREIRLTAHSSSGSNVTPLKASNGPTRSVSSHRTIQKTEDRNCRGRRSQTLDNHHRRGVHKWRRRCYSRKQPRRRDCRDAQCAAGAQR